MMRTLIGTALAATVALAAAAPAVAAPDRTGSVSMAAKVFTWNGAAAPGLNISYYDETAAPGACGKDVRSYCDTTLIKVDDTYTGSKKLNVRLDGFQFSDYDLRVYRSDATGAEKNYEGSPTGDGAGIVPLETFNGDPETKEIAGVKAGDFVLVSIVYFTTVPAETPRVTATLK